MSASLRASLVPIYHMLQRLPCPDPQQSKSESMPLAQSMLNAVCDLLFCPEFTVAPNSKTTSRDEADDLQVSQALLMIS